MTTWLWLVLAIGCPKATPTGASTPADREPPAPSPYALAEDASPALLRPSKATLVAPAQYDVRLTTTQGDIVLRVERAWSPLGADRFYNLVEAGFYDQSAFFRTIDNFVAQFGLAANPDVNAAWKDSTIPDDPVVLSNTRGRVTFAKSAAPNSRTTQIFVNLANNNALDSMGFAAFAEVVEGMHVVDALHRTGEGPPGGQGPSQGELRLRGNGYLDDNFPEIDRILTATVIEPQP